MRLFSKGEDDGAYQGSIARAVARASGVTLKGEQWPMCPVCETCHDPLATCGKPAT